MLSVAQTGMEASHPKSVPAALASHLTHCTRRTRKQAGRSWHP